MRFLFSSVDGAFVENAGKRLTEAGIPCELRYRPAIRNGLEVLSYKELWVRSERELEWAIGLLAMHCEVGRN